MKVKKKSKMSLDSYFKGLDFYGAMDSRARGGGTLVVFSLFISICVVV